MKAIRFKKGEGAKFDSEYKAEKERAKDFLYSEGLDNKEVKKYLRMWHIEVCNQAMDKMKSVMFDGEFYWSLKDIKDVYKRS